jgi:hypothetical protein
MKLEPAFSRRLKNLVPRDRSVRIGRAATLDG